MITPFVEQDCTIKHEGQEFTSRVEWICDCSDGCRRGVVYAKPDKMNHNWREAMHFSASGIVTDWHGNKIADAIFGHPFRGGFGAKMRTVRFTLDGVTYAGRYGCDWSQAVRVRSTRKVS